MIYTFGKDFKEFNQELCKNKTLQIDEEMFYYWLEVLPPIYMNKKIDIDGVSKNCSYGFAEGSPVMDVWKDGGNIYCKQRTS